MNLELKKVSELMTDDRMPQYQTKGAAGVDLIACIKAPIELLPESTVIVPTGIAISINDINMCAMIYPRSGLGVKGIVLANNVGIIDSDYQGEIKVALYNRGKTDFVIEPFSRIAQMIFQPVIRADWNVVDGFSLSTERGAGGFGSTGYAVA